MHSLHSYTLAIAHRLCGRIFDCIIDSYRVYKYLYCSTIIFFHCICQCVSSAHQIENENDKNEWTKRGREKKLFARLNEKIHKNWSDRALVLPYTRAVRSDGNSFNFFWVTMLMLATRFFPWRCCCCLASALDGRWWCPTVWTVAFRYIVICVCVCGKFHRSDQLIVLEMRERARRKKTTSEHLSTLLREIWLRIKNIGNNNKTEHEIGMGGTRVTRLKK